jgi:hypothetical protein
VDEITPPRDLMREEFDRLFDRAMAPEFMTVNQDEFDALRTIFARKCITNNRYWFIVDGFIS